MVLCRFLMAQSYAAFITFLAWISNSIPRPVSKRAVALALINAFSQLGNIAGSCVSLETAQCAMLMYYSRYVWPTPWGPTYRLDVFLMLRLLMLTCHFCPRYSYAICIATNGLAIIMCYIFRQHLASLNKKAIKDAEGSKEKPYLYLL